MKLKFLPCCHCTEPLTLDGEKLRCEACERDVPLDRVNARDRRKVDEAIRYVRGH